MTLERRCAEPAPTVERTRTMEVHADASLTDVAEQRIKGVREREQLRAEVEAGVRSEVEAEYRAEMGRLRYLPSPAYLQTPQSRR